MIDQSALLDLASRIARLSPDRRDPERWHCEKSEIAAELRRLAGQQSSATVRKYSHQLTQLTCSDAK